MEDTPKHPWKQNTSLYQSQKTVKIPMLNLTSIRQKVTNQQSF